MTARQWGLTRAGMAHLLDISDGADCRAQLSDFGARLVALWCPDRDGTPADIVLGHDRAEDYETPASRYVGATCGRYANRIANGEIRLDRDAFQLNRNEGPNHLHGGADGFDARMWTIARADAASATFELRSPDGDMGYPGTVLARVTYAFPAPARLEIAMEATVTGRPTVINMVNHAYFNLAGQGSGTVDDQHLRIAADAFLPVDAALLPTGAMLPTPGTPFDFRTLRPIGAVVPPGGFDHNLCLDPTSNTPQIEARDPVSGRGFRLWTDQPGVQLYTARHLPQGLPGKAGKALGPRAGFTLETQHWPDSPNQPGFPATILRPGETYRHLMRFDFLAG